jgi:hypothetical protein
MAHFALSHGSFGDLLETAKLAVKVVRLLRADGRTKLSQERLALATKLQTLNSDLMSLDSIAAGVIDLSSTHTLLAVIRVGAEVEACRMVLVQFLDRLAASRGFLGSIMVALSEESELARFKTEISSPMKVVRTLLSMLNLYIRRPFRPWRSTHIFCVEQPRRDSKRSWTRRALNFCGSETRSTISATVLLRTTTLF